jgi:hypothetical protein
VRRGPDGKWRTVGGIEVSKTQAMELDAKLTRTEDPVHRLFIVNHKYPPSPIQEAQCKIAVTEKVSWAEPIMPLRGALRTQKRFMLGAYAFYTRNQAEKKKVILLLQAMKAGSRHQTLASESRAQLERFKETGEVK